MESAVSNDAIPPLDTLGPRILVCGPSASGKSRLAAAIGAARGLPIVHLDQLRFIPGSNWVERPDADFAADIIAATTGERWVIEGNYFRWIEPRLARATGLVSISGWRLANYGRYLRRCLLETSRTGTLAGAPDRINWKMSRWILLDEPRRPGPKIARLRASGLPLAEPRSMAELKELYAAWNLTL